MSLRRSEQAFAQMIEDLEFINSCKRDTDGDGNCGHNCNCVIIRQRYLQSESENVPEK